MSSPHFAASAVGGKSLPKVVIHTDGGCQGNPGIGAWAWVAEYKGQVWEGSGAVAATTNNRMELQAAIEALTRMNQTCAVELHTDSNYLRDGITKWIAGWKRNGWQTAAKEPVKNRDLWQALDEATQRHRIEWKWLKGHAGHPLNEHCDVLAGRAMEKLRRETSPAALKEALRAFEAVRS